MSGNSFGKLFAVTTFGESHGLALGCVVDGCPPGMELSESDIEGDLDRRRPGRSRHTTQRNEPDQVRILSGVFEGKTTGTPIIMRMTTARIAKMATMSVYSTSAEGSPDETSPLLISRIRSRTR